MSRLPVVAAVLSLLLCATGLASPLTAPPNFGVVVPEGIYRGGQPSDSDLKYLKEHGVHTILKLNSHNLDNEREEAERLGLSFVNIPLEPSSVGETKSCSSVAKAVALLSDQSRWPVYVHCSRGRDRTGYVVGAYREIVERQPWPAVEQELRRFGHDGSIRFAYPQIGRELQHEIPTCGDEIARALAHQSQSSPHPLASKP